MKKMKKVFAVILSLCMMFTASCFAKLTVEAEGATTYTLKVVDDEWRFQPNYPWDDVVQHRELYYMYQNFKDGDKVVIIDSSDKKLELELSKNISNLTVQRASQVIVTAPYVEESYILGGALVAINADVNKAYVYDNAIVNFNKNVQYLEVLTERSDAALSSNIGVAGQVAHAYAHEGDHVVFDIYDVKSGKFSIVNGGFNIAEGNYTKTATASTVVTTPAQTTTTAPAVSSSAADELDDVPKTGDIVSYYWLLVLAAACMVSGLYLKKKNA